MSEPTPEAVEAVAKVVEVAVYGTVSLVDGLDAEWVASDVLTFLAEHPEHLPGVRQDTTYGVPVGDTGIIMSTYDGTAREFTRWVLQGPWKETA